MKELKFISRDDLIFLADMLDKWFQDHEDFIDGDEDEQITYHFNDKLMDRLLKEIDNLKE